MVSEGQKCGRGVDKLFRVQSLEQWGGGKKKAVFFFPAFCFTFSIGNGKNHFASSWNATLITDSCRKIKEFMLG